MLRLSRLTDYAVVVLVKLARSGGVTTSTSLAAETGLPEPTVAKVLKALATGGLVASQRGARGGYRLELSLEAISITRVITVIDGPIALAACVDGGAGGCQAETLCPIRGRWDVVNTAIRTTLDGITLAHMESAAMPAALSAPNAARFELAGL